MFTAEVERAISTHPAVAEVAVIGVPDARWGEAVHAIIVPRPGQTLTVADLTAHCAPLIANYKHPRGLTLRTEPCRSPAPARCSSATCARRSGRGMGGR